MNKKNFAPLLGIAFVVAIAATGIFYGLFVGKLSSTNRSGKTLVVAARNVKAGSVLVAEDLKLVPWSSDPLPKGAYETPEQVVGTTAIETINDGEPVLDARLATRDAKRGVTVPVGFRAVSVHVVDSSGVLALLRPGYCVDVQVVSGRSQREAEVEVRTALHQLTVLSVSQPEQSSQGGQPIPVVTLLARPREADVLALGDSAARVRLTLRNPLDEDKPASGALTLGTLMRASASRGSEATRSRTVAAKR